MSSVRCEVPDGVFAVQTEGLCHGDDGGVQCGFVSSMLHEVGGDRRGGGRGGSCATQMDAVWCNALVRGRTTFVCR